MRNGISFRERMEMPLKEKILHGVLFSLASIAVVIFLLFIFKT